MNLNAAPGDRPLLSLVVPMYNEESSIGAFFDQVLPVLETVTADYEVICVDDGSRDKTLEHVSRRRADDPRIKILSLSRNFGKEAALSAGLDHARGAAVIPMDADLQHPPDAIPEMVEQWRAGYDVVLAVRGDRLADPPLRRWATGLFYRIFGRFAETPIPANAGDFRLMDIAVVDALRALPERARFMKGLYAWVGFKQGEITYDCPPRQAGNSKWPFWKLWNFALDGLFSFSMAPLRLWTYLGAVVALLALAYAFYIVAKTMILGVDVPGFASLMVAMLFFSGLNMIGIGILGEYLGRTFIEAKRRPLYIIRKSIGFQDEDRDT